MGKDDTHSLERHNSWHSRDGKSCFLHSSETSTYIKSLVVSQCQEACFLKLSLGIFRYWRLSLKKFYIFHENSLSSRTESGYWVIESKAVRPHSKLETPFLLCLGLFLHSWIPLLPLHLTCLTSKSWWDHSEAGLARGHTLQWLQTHWWRIKLIKALFMCETIKLHSGLPTEYYQDSTCLPLWYGRDTLPKTHC